MLEDYVAIDLEMTGLRANRDSILEIGAVLVEKKQIKAEYQAMINPHLKLSEEVVRLTGITNAMAADGRELDDVFPEIMEFCKDSILLGHNVIFDYSFLKQAALNRKVSFERRGVDTLKLARKLLPAEKKKTLQALCDRFGIYREHQHRALDDAKATRELYERLETIYGGRNPELFKPYPLQYKAKKQTPATLRQKRHLKELADYHKVTLNVSWETLTKNEASRQIDKLIMHYGRLPQAVKESKPASVSLGFQLHE